MDATSSARGPAEVAPLEACRGHLARYAETARDRKVVAGRAALQQEDAGPQATRHRRHSENRVQLVELVKLI